MANSDSRSLALVLVTLFVFHTAIGQTLHCYSCNYVKGVDSPCASPSKNSQKVVNVTCSSPNQCVLYRIRNPLTSTETVSRACEVNTICDILKRQESDSNKLEECKTCQSELCNSAKMSQFSAIMLATLGILGGLYSYVLTM